MGYSYTLVNFWRLILILEGKLSLWDIISKLRDLRGKSGLFQDFSWTLVPIGTKSRNRDLFAATVIIMLIPVR